MIDLTTYALLRKQIATAASGISDVRAEGDELVFVLVDGHEVRVAIPATEIRDAVVRDDVLVLTLEDNKEVIVDATLTQSGQAADAKVTGEAVSQIKDEMADGTKARMLIERHGNPIVVNDAVEGHIKRAFLTVKPFQKMDGIPSPDNVMLISPGSRNVYFDVSDGVNSERVDIELPEGIAGGVIDVFGKTCKETWKIYEFTGNESFIQQEVVGHQRFVVNVTDKQIYPDTNGANAKLLCSHLVVDTAPISSNNKDCAISGYKNSTYIYFRWDAMQTVDALKEHLVSLYTKGEPLTIAYETTKTNSYGITASKDGVEIHVGENIITTDADELHIEYVADTKRYVDDFGNKIDAKKPDYTAIDQFKLRDIYRAKALGGNVDDADAIQAYIDAEDYVYIPEGTYTLSKPLAINKVGLVIEGAGYGWKTMLKTANDNTDCLIHVDSGNGSSLMLTIRDICFQVTTSANAIRSSYNLIDSLIENCWFNGNNKSTCLNIYGTHTFITKCWFENFKWVMECNPNQTTNFCIIDNCDIWNNVGGFSTYGNIIIRNCVSTRMHNGNFLQVNKGTTQLQNTTIVVGNIDAVTSEPATQATQLIRVDADAELHIDNVKILESPVGETVAYLYLVRVGDTASLFMNGSYIYTPSIVNHAFYMAGGKLISINNNTIKDIKGHEMYSTAACECIEVKNNKIYCGIDKATKNAINIYANATKWAEVTNNSIYDDINTDTYIVRIAEGTPGVIKDNEFRVVVPETQLFVNNSNLMEIETKRSAVPGTGMWGTRSKIWFTTPTTHIGAICTEAGSPGTWKKFGALES